jgi:hypothetical protein
MFGLAATSYQEIPGTEADVTRHTSSGVKASRLKERFFGLEAYQRVQTLVTTGCV